MSDPFVITQTSPMADGQVGTYYNQAINYSPGGSVPPLYFFVESGILPPGLAIGGGGITEPYIFGTPTVGGIYDFTIKGVDSTTPTQLVATKDLQISINGPGGQAAEALTPMYVTSGGETFEVLQVCLGKEPSESISFSEYESELGEGGFEISTLYGPDTGRKRWKLNFPVMSGAAADLKVTASDGTPITFADYIWDLYCRTKRSGRPFVITSSRNNQLYLAKFSNLNLEYVRFVTMLYSSQLELRQVCVEGVTVFDPYRVKNLWGWYEGPESFDYGAGLARDRSGNGHDLTIVGGVSNAGDTSNGLPTQRFNGSSGYLRYDGGASLTLGHCLMMLKYRGSTFSNTFGLLTQANAFNHLLIGSSGGTELSTFGGPLPVKYWKNSVAYDADDQQAPMNAFGVVHARWSPGVALTAPQIGKRNGTAATFAAIDTGAIFLIGGTPETDVWELSEHIQTKYDI